MSSEYGGGCCGAEKGNNGIYSDMFHTMSETEPWWRVDLQQTHCIYAVFFMNRGHPDVVDGVEIYLCE